MLDSLRDALAETAAQPCPDYVVYATYSIALVILYLVDVPNTRLMRIGLWPLGVFFAGWLILTVKRDAVWAMRLSLTALLLNVATTRWAFSPGPIRHHPLPRQPFWSGLRSDRFFKVFDLFINMYRNVNVVGYSPPLELDTRSYPYLRALAQHLYDFLVGLILFDGASYPLLVLAPKSFGALGMVGGNYELWCRDLAVTWGVPLLAVRIYWTITLAIMCHCGTTMCWNVLAIWGIASGVYIPEEWPTLTRKPILSTSLNQFWSYRWHQTMRDLYISLANPLRVSAHAVAGASGHIVNVIPQTKPLYIILARICSILSRPAYILSIFLMSVLHHLITYWPLEHKVHAYPYLLFFLGNGLGCILERAYYKVTGKKVHGILGAIWVWTVMYNLSQPIVTTEYSSGWVGEMRGPFSEDPWTSLVAVAVYKLGWGESPDVLKSRLLVLRDTDMAQVGDAVMAAM